MERVAKQGSYKIVPERSLPLTEGGVLDRIIVDLSVLDATDDGLLLVEAAEGVDTTTLEASNGVPFRIG